MYTVAPLNRSTRAARCVVERALACRGHPLRGLGRPAEHRGDAGPLRLEGKRAADGTEADDAEFGGAHEGKLASKHEGRHSPCRPCTNRSFSRQSLAGAVVNDRLSKMARVPPEPANRTLKMPGAPRPADSMHSTCATPGADVTVWSVTSPS